MQINVCLAADENYLKYMATTMVSILTNAADDDDLHFFILCNGVLDKSKEYIKSLKRFKDFNIKFIDIDIDEFSIFPAGGPHITNTTYYRYKIADICHDIDKIIYLDCDTVIKSSLRELFSQDLTGYYLGGVEDVGYSYWRNYEPKYTCSGFYINAGMLLINLFEWRKNGIGDKLMEYTLNNKEKIAIGDQDVINTVCKDKIKPLDYKYNAQDTFYRDYPELEGNPNRADILKAAENPVVIHYTNFKKPWNNPSIPRADDFWKTYLKENSYSFKSRLVYLREMVLHYIWIVYSRKLKNKTLEVLGLKKKVKRLSK